MISIVTVPFFHVLYPFDFVCFASRSSSLKIPGVGSWYTFVLRQENHMLSLESEIVRLSKD